MNDCTLLGIATIKGKTITHISYTVNSKGINELEQKIG